MHNLVLGAMYFGTRTDEATSRQILDHFVDAGGTMIDTSNNYSFWEDPSGFGGQSEAVLGRWLAGHPGLREQLYISTKVGAQPLAPGGFPDNLEGLSPRAINESVQASLQRLGTDRIDLYWAHVEDRSVPLKDMMAAFGSLVENDTVGRVGCSNWPIWRVEQARQAARGWQGFTALQLMHSYLQPRPGAQVSWQPARFGCVTDQTLDYVDAQQLEVWAYSPLLKGGYTHPDRLGDAYDHEGNDRRLAGLDRVAAELDASRNQVVLAWLSGGEAPITPIVGVSTVAQLDEILEATKLTLSSDQRAGLDATA
ncbi:aldo/keto reductase [Actinopolymorpha rutila]|uniref:Aryl-alcohol dehydrogenase-like predicted oxidoreductase n=1 Tax=Actinopolymorpha rutila TaxID=446787 RepID=A0A852ZGF9_9ACTN|nr:aldo/keto reductase [Actinopolymorpha rutila]NYH92251.1 aryl-alcohol dehydrogenase-like predicted oxidoreductase [Actinopolymorpha rutila]